jgi:hypothetical protein
MPIMRVWKIISWQNLEKKTEEFEFDFNIVGLIFQEKSKLPAHGEKFYKYLSRSFYKDIHSYFARGTPLSNLMAQ